MNARKYASSISPLRVSSCRAAVVRRTDEDMHSAAVRLSSETEFLNEKGARNVLCFAFVHFPVFFSVLTREGELRLVKITELCDLTRLSDFFSDELVQKETIYSYFIVIIYY